MKIVTLRDLWVDELKDLYNAEHQILKALPKMAKAAADDQLRQAFEEHLEQSKGHVERLEQIFELIEETPRGKKCKGVEGIIAEGAEMMDMGLPEAVSDAALIAAAQRVEHYEIAAYGTVKTYAEILGESDAAELLEQTLAEEKATDETLSGIAEEVNPEAASAGDESSNGVVRTNGKSKAKGRAGAAKR